MSKNSTNSSQSTTYEIVPTVKQPQPAPISDSSILADNESVIIDEFEYQYKEEFEPPSPENEQLLNVEVGHQSSSTESVSTSTTPPSRSDNNKTAYSEKHQDEQMIHQTQSRSCSTSSQHSASSSSSNDGWIDVRNAINEYRSTNLDKGESEYNDEDEKDNVELNEMIISGNLIDQKNEEASASVSRDDDGQANEDSNSKNSIKLFYI